MGNFETMLIVGVALLFITLIVANEGLPAVCGDDVLSCPDGSVISRDALNNCEFPVCPNIELLPYCSSGVVTVEVFDNYVRTVSSIPGAGFSVYGLNSTRCPMVSPNAVSDDCRDLLQFDWNVTVNCSNVDYWVFECPSDYFVAENYSWINCEPDLFPEYEDYCQPRYKQWIELNCDIEVIN